MYFKNLLIGMQLIKHEQIIIYPVSHLSLSRGMYKTELFALNFLERSLLFAVNRLSF